MYPTGYSSRTNVEDAKSLDELVGPLGQVGEGSFLDLAVFAEEDGRWEVSVGYAFASTWVLSYRIYWAISSE